MSRRLSWASTTPTKWSWHWAACPATRSWPMGHSRCASSSNPVERLVAALQEHRVHCAELIPNRNAVPVLGAYVRALRQAGIAVLAGTEHNTLDMVPMEPHCAGGEPVPEDSKDIFWEGACVIAAHQFLGANGKSGYVDAYGEPAPSYSSPDARIKAFARLGAAVIEEYADMARLIALLRRGVSSWSRLHNCRLLRPPLPSWRPWWSCRTPTGRPRAGPGRGRQHFGEIRRPPVGQG